MSKQQDREDIQKALKHFKGKTGVPYSENDKYKLNGQGRREKKKLDQHAYFHNKPDPRQQYRIKTRKSFD